MHYFNNRTDSSEPAVPGDRKQHPLAFSQTVKETPKSRLSNNRMCSCSVPGTMQLSTSMNLSSPGRVRGSSDFSTYAPSYVKLCACLLRLREKFRRDALFLWEITGKIYLPKSTFKIFNPYAPMVFRVDCYFLRKKQNQKDRIRKSYRNWIGLAEESFPNGARRTFKFLGSIQSASIFK